jgi:hypothetical protein
MWTWSWIGDWADGGRMTMVRRMDRDWVAEGDDIWEPRGMRMRMR